MNTFKSIASSMVLAACLLGSGAVSAQEKKVAKADAKFEEFAFVDAREIYKKVAENGYESDEVLQKVGDTYFFNAEYADAAKWYGKLFSANPNQPQEYMFRYAISLRSIEDYTMADDMMAKFASASGNDDRGMLYMNEKNYLEEIDKQSGRFRIQLAGVNSSSSDFGTAFYGEEDVVFASNRGSAASTTLHEWNEKPFYDLYVGYGTENGDLQGTNRLPKVINSKFHESTAAYSADGNTVYFTRNNYERGGKFITAMDGTNMLKVYKSTKEEGRWSKPMELPFNKNNYSVAHPALNAQGDKLYFASNMPGGSGSSDLYMVTVNGDDYGTPVNLGSTINTAGRETFPFVSSDGRLYFASTGRPGLGGLDIFTVQLGADGMPMGGVYNLGEPVNSPYDDFAFVMKPGKNTGYFTSNREGGMGDDDIYQFVQREELREECEQEIAGVVRDADTNEPISDASVTLVDMNNKVLNAITTDSSGAYSFVVDCETGYFVRGFAPDYAVAEAVFTTNATDGEVTTKDLLMKKVRAALTTGTDLADILNIPIIYFDLDKSNIRPDAAVELQKVIAVMNQYPQLQIDVRSHTDSRASDSYNMSLSNRRAASTMNYIVEQGGISRGRLSGKGYGEEMLVNNCTNGVPCSESEHQRNRRSEFIVVGGVKN